jgi:hypothetical protein
MMNFIMFSLLNIIIKYYSLYVCYLFSGFLVVVLFCVFLLWYVAVSLLFFYKFSYRCHRVETKLQ